MSRYFYLISLFVFLSLAFGCANLSTMSTGRALKPGEGRFHFALMVSPGKDTLNSVLPNFETQITNTAVDTAGDAASNAAGNATSNATGNAAADQTIKEKAAEKAKAEASQKLSKELDNVADKIPALGGLELIYQKGLFKNFDMELRLRLIGPVSLGGKYQFLEWKNIATAAGLQIGYWPGIEQKIPGGDEKVKLPGILDVGIPLIASYHPANWFGIYVAPKYVMRKISHENNYTLHILAPTVGFQLGDGFGLFAEVTAQKAIGGDMKDYKALQGNVSLFF